MKLISMTDFVISQWDKDLTREEYSQSMIHYATFLLKPLTLGMFVPCDENENILLEPDYGWIGTPKMEEYKKSKERVLFKGFKVSDRNNCINENIKILRFEGSNQVWAEIKNNEANFRFPNLLVKSIEDLDDLLLELTDSAIKQLGL